jgi:hypothetical protein
VIDTLNAEGPDIDIILSEIDLPMAKGFKMLKYIMRDKDLRRIPVISKTVFMFLVFHFDFLDFWRLFYFPCVFFFFPRSDVCSG